MSTSEPVIERFWRWVVKTDGCWEWKGARLKAGYGRFSWKRGDGHSGQASRFSWELHNGPIPDRLWVLHKCDNPPCVRPDHLFLGTAQDNTDDIRAKGRFNAPKGERNAHARMTAQAVRDIRALYEIGMTREQIGRRYQISGSNVWCIVMRKTWAHVA